MIYGNYINPFLVSMNIKLDDSKANLSKYVGYKVNEDEVKDALVVFRNYYSSRPIPYPGDHEMYDIMSHYAAKGLDIDKLKSLIITQFK